MPSQGYFAFCLCVVPFFIILNFILQVMFVIVCICYNCFVCIEYLNEYIDKFGHKPAIAEGRGNNAEIAIEMMEAVLSNKPLEILNNPEGAEL